MIDPIQSLAFSIQANRGVYAVLQGFIKVISAKHRQYHGTLAFK